MNNIIPTIHYLWLTVLHKIYVFQAGRITKAPLWRLVIHDWTKFLPCEAPHYGRQFYGNKGDPGGFARAWLHHQNSNPHHWEYWIPRTGHNVVPGAAADNIPLPMPEWAVREMVADWLGASRAYGKAWPLTLGTWDWYSKNYESKIKPRLHPDTIRRLEHVLAEVMPLMQAKHDVPPAARVATSVDDKYSPAAVSAIYDTKAPLTVDPAAFTGAQTFKPEAK